MGQEEIQRTEHPRTKEARISKTKTRTHFWSFGHFVFWIYLVLGFFGSWFFVLNIYPFPRTVSSTWGSVESSRSFSRSRATCMSIVRVGRPSGLMRQTLAS